MTSGRAPTVPHSVELLERALGYTRGRLAGITSDQMLATTPCAGWALYDLLAHMDDALDAFLEATDGTVTMQRSAEVGSVAVIQAKACALLGAWTAAAGARTGTISVGDRAVPSGLLVGTAALEVAVHGWDVGWATGDPAPIPGDLALALLPVADIVVTSADRGVRFGPPVRIGTDAPPDHGLLAHLGRSPGPIRPDSRVPRAGTPPAF